ncbi:Membrane transport protein [Dillenia turbinata]|uniref:Membrane transport protein n=1 Tax=Dillenia turbinata TaxID=194707 RepID=A0AAN8W0G0_9MAGN
MLDSRLQSVYRVGRRDAHTFTFGRCGFQALSDGPEDDDEGFHKLGPLNNAHGHTAWSGKETLPTLLQAGSKSLPPLPYNTYTLYMLTAWLHILGKQILGHCCINANANFWFREMGLLELFVTSSVPVLKVLLVTAVGSFLALDHVNIMGEDARKHLNNVVFYVFNPSLVSTNLARTITFDSMVSLWFMPLNILITFIVGSALGWIVTQVTRAPPQLHGLILGCCAAGNLGNMLLIIIPAVCKEKGSPFGEPGACHSYGLAYVSLSMAIGAIYLWSYVYNIVRISASNIPKEIQINGSSIGKSASESLESPKSSFIGPLLSSKDYSEDDAGHYTIACPEFEGQNEAAISVNNMHELWKLLGKVDLKSLLAPSTIGAIVGFIIGLIPQIRKALVGDRAPLRVIQDSVSLLGYVVFYRNFYFRSFLSGVQGQSMNISDKIRVYNHQGLNVQ